MFHFDDKQFADKVWPKKKKFRFKEVPFGILVAHELDDNPTRLHVRH
jgi:hypothetical protein